MQLSNSEAPEGSWTSPIGGATPFATARGGWPCRCTISRNGKGGGPCCCFCCVEGENGFSRLQKQCCVRVGSGLEAFRPS